MEEEAGYRVRKRDVLGPKGGVYGNGGEEPVRQDEEKYNNYNLVYEDKCK